MNQFQAHRNRCRIAGRAAPLVIFLIAAFTIAAVAWGWTRLNGDGESENAILSEVGSWYTVRERSFDMLISSNGELEAANQVELKSEVEGQTTIVEILPEGTHVEEGEVIIRLADDKITEALEQERLNVEQGRADKLAAEQDLAIEKNEAENSTRAAEVKLELAKLELSKWKEGDDPQKQRELKLALEKANRNVRRSKEDLELSKQLFAEDFISKAEVEDDELAVIEAEDALKSAKLAIEVYDSFTRPKEFKKVQSDVEQAAAELDRTKRRNASRIAQAEAKLKGEIKQLKIREERLAAKEEQLAATVIIAPQDGLVVYSTTVSGRRRRSSEPIAPGRTVHKNESLVILPDTSKMIAKLKVHESMIARVKLNQPVTIRIDARGNEPIEGKVCEIGVMAEDGGWMNRDLREYMVTVELPPSVENLKPAMRCVGQIVLGRVEDAITVPIQAVFTEKRQRFCYVPADNGRVKRQPVKIGRSSETLVEIASGLEKGDRVLLRQPRPGEVMQVQPAGGAGAGSSEGDAEGRRPSTNGEQRARQRNAAEGSDASASEQPRGERARGEGRSSEGASGEGRRQREAATE